MEPADVSGKKLNRAMGAVSQAEAAAINQEQKLPERHIPGELDSRMFAHQVGLDDDDQADPTLKHASQAFGAYSRALADLHERERAIRADSTQTSHAHDMRVSQLAEKAVQPVAEKTQAAYEASKREIAKIDSQIDDAFKSSMTIQEAAEIRAHVKSLPDGKARREFLRKADEGTVAAVLAGKSFLSGLSDAEANTVRYDTLKRRFPDEVKRRAKLEAAKEAIAAGWERYHREIATLRDPNADALQSAADKAKEATSSPFSLDD